MVTLDELATLSARTIADREGVNVRTVQRWRKSLGIVMPTRRYSVEAWELARRLLEDGASYNEVARTIGAHSTVVADRFPGHGWTFTQGGEYGQAIRAYHHL